MISAVAILMLCNGIRIFLKSKKNTINEIGCVMEFMTHLFRFFIFSFLHFFHRISRMNRRHSCLSDYSRIFADIWPLANGSRPIYAPVVFVTQISQMTQIFLCVDYFVPQISQMTQIFLCVDYFVTQISQMTQIFLCGTYSNSRGYLHRPDRSPLRKSVSNRLIRNTSA